MYYLVCEIFQLIGLVTVSILCISSVLKSGPSEQDAEAVRLFMLELCKNDKRFRRGKDEKLAEVESGRGREWLEFTKTNILKDNIVLHNVVTFMFIYF